MRRNGGFEQRQCRGHLWGAPNSAPSRSAPSPTRGTTQATSTIAAPSRRTPRWCRTFRRNASPPSPFPAPALPSGLACNSNPIQGWTAANNYTGQYTLPLPTDATASGFVCYNSIDTSQSASVTFTPGYIYYVKGDFTTGGGAPLTGNGVSFYVGGNVNFANGVTSNLTAPTEQ